MNQVQLFIVVRKCPLLSVLYYRELKIRPSAVSGSASECPEPGYKLKTQSPQL